MPRPYKRKNAWMKFGSASSVLPYLKRIEAQRHFLLAIEEKLPELLDELHGTGYEEYTNGHGEAAADRWAQRSRLVNTNGHSINCVRRCAVYTLNARARDDGRLPGTFFDHLQITSTMGRWARWEQAPAFDTLIEGEWENWLLGQATDLPAGVDMAYLRPDGTLLLLGEKIETRHIPDRPLVDSFKSLSAVFTIKNVSYDPTVDSRKQGLKRMLEALTPQIENELRAIEENIEHLTGAERASPIKREHFELLAYACRDCPRSNRDWGSLMKTRKVNLDYRSLRRNIKLAYESMGFSRDDLPAHLTLPHD